MARLPIRIYPDPVLRVRCVEVETFDEEIATLVADMKETMIAAPGIGLAAPQIGVESRIALVDLSVGEEESEFYVLINPEITSGEGEGVEAEGCLSIPDFTEKVTRPTQVSVTYQDLHGERHTLQADGWLARAICHELDHLDGVLFVDHLKGLRRERAKRALRRLIREQES
ncbi:MAG: peptide deformylase [Thermoanaerobaculia bacterium]|nr:peptide deformylase [Thermoanaerobaculia bacterium]